jgi:periplasmic protein TonB
MFDSVLKRERLPKRRLAAGFLVGFLVYAGVATFAFWASGRVEERERRDVEVTFVMPPPPPPPPPPAQRTQSRPSRPREASRPRALPSEAIVAPTRIPDAKPPEREPFESPATGGVEGGEVGGVRGGIVGGVPGGVVGGVVDAPDVRMEFDERMTHPQYLGGPSPQYTQKALEREVQGTMVVKCVVTAEGRVHGCRVLKSLPFMDRAVVDALERRRYKPATLGGRPVEVDYTFRITLRLPD